MKMRTRTRRPGLGLAEVLIAIFVLSIGLLGIMALFPLGAVQMAQALKDENTAQLNQSVSAMARWVWKEDFPRPVGAGAMRPYSAALPPAPQLPPPTYYGPAFTARRYDPIVDAMANPNFPHNPDYNAIVPGGGNIPFQGTLPLIPMNSTAPSYPLFLDPVGWNNSTNAGTVQQYWLAGMVNSIPRRSLRRLEWVDRNTAPFPPSPPFPVNSRLFWVPMPTALKNVLINRYCYRLDDVGYGRDGTPYGAAADIGITSGTTGTPWAGEIQRDGRYSCAFMLKRRANNLWWEADLSVVVYSGRSIDAPSAETAYTASFVQGSAEVLITYTGQTPNLRKGQWILDATMARPTGGNPPLIAEPHGYFYRIINVSEPAAGQLLLELQTPAYASTVQANGTPYGVAIHMEGVVEVFERSTLTPFTMPVP